MSKTVDVWNEVQFTGNGVSISLYSEDGHGVTVEDETWFTWDELENRKGEIVSLGLTDATRDDLTREDDEREVISIEDLDLHEDVEESILSGKKEARLPNEGDIMVDANAPSWSQDARVEVVDIADEKAGEYTIQAGRSREGSHELTIANPDADPDEAVIEARYLSGNNKVYAFPESRLKDE
jgi:hypothetical protein